VRAILQSDAWLIGVVLKDEALDDHMLAVAKDESGLADDDRLSATRGAQDDGLILRPAQTLQAATSLRGVSPIRNLHGLPGPQILKEMGQRWRLRG
jgi:hypothetical protein